MNSYNTTEFDNDKIRTVFGPLSIDKRRLPSSSLTAIGVPSFVGEWLLDKIVPGVGDLSLAERDKLNDFIQKAFPRKDDKEVIKFYLTQGEIHKLIGLMQVRVKLEQRREQIPEPLARIPALNLEECRIPTDIVDRNQMLLRQGSWGKISLVMRTDGNVDVIDFDPFQCSSVNLEEYSKCRGEFSIEEWRNLMLCSMGFNSNHHLYNRESVTWILARLLPLVESNYHIMELAPKGTGKSFVYENISNKVAVISGGKVTPARLFIDGRTKEIGLLGRHDVVVLDEIQSLTFDNPDEIIGPLKNYLASGRYNRSGFQDVSSDCSLVMLANIQLNDQQRPSHDNNLISDLPKFFYETAFLDRFAGIIPGWKIPKFQRDMIAFQTGLKMDFFGEVLLALRRDNSFIEYANRHTRFDDKVTIRDQKAILKSASGFLKILYPNLDLTLSDYKRDCLEPAQEMRQYIRTLLYNFDDEFKQTGRQIYIDVE